LVTTNYATQVGRSKSVMHQYNAYDGKIHLWIHFHCLFTSISDQGIHFINNIIEIFQTIFYYDIQPQPLITCKAMDK
jgi:plasmid rolling circle replication initiator protein Rep